MTLNQKTKLLLAVSPAILASVSYGSIAFAQEAPNPPASTSDEDAATTSDAIIVTGSRIPRANFDTAQPAVVLSSAQIEQRGYTNIGDALNELPAFGVPVSAVGQQAGAFGSGQTFVNFFGLGDQRTLTVVNGRRFVSSNTASIFGPTGAGSQVDFNVIPTIIVDRVETIAVGGAPVYGADAIAGTVNIITKREYSGVKLDAQYGITERGDAANYRFRALAGTKFGDDRGSIVLAGEYNHADGLLDGDRSRSRINSFFTTPVDPASPFANTYIGDRRIASISVYGIPLVSDFIPLSPGQTAQFSGYQPSVLDAQGRPLRFNQTGNLVPIDFGQQTGNLVNSNGGDGFVLPGNLLTETERYLGTALAQYEVSDGIRLFGEAWYAHSKGIQLADQPVYNTALFGNAGDPDGNLIISINNPFLTPASRATIAQNLATSPYTDDPNTFLLGRANVDLSSGRGSTTVELYRFVAGVDGDFHALGRDLHFEIVGNYGRSTTQGRQAELNEQNFLNAINAATDTNGQIVCAPGFNNSPVATLSATCAPINPFGSQISQAARNYITTIATPRAVNDQKVLTASISGSLFNIWDRSLGFAIGYEHREESAGFDPGLFYFGLVDPSNPTAPRTSFGRGSPVDPVAGRFHTNEFFGELTLPLIGHDQNIPFVRSLELNGAIRYIDHSLAGGDPTYTAGGKWEIIPDLTIRGNYTRSVRSPAITEYFNPTSQIFVTANDPCDSRFLAGGPNPASRAANCASAGLPANFQSNIVDFTAKGTLGGNPNLTNEVADAFTIGAIIRPRFVRNFTLAVDWIDIKLKNAVESLTAQQVLQGCYDAPSYPNAFCSRFTRDAGGQITNINTGFANAASRHFRGLVAELAWTIPTPFLGRNSNISIGANYLYNDKLETRVGLGDVTTLAQSIGYSRHQVTTNVTYNDAGFSGQIQVQYIGKALNDPDLPRSNFDYPTVPAVAFVNGSVSYQINDRFGLNFVANNIFDTNIPFPAPANGGTVTYFDGVLGRNFRFGVSVKY